jgi:hypothetical protein
MLGNRKDRCYTFSISFNIALLGEDECPIVFKLHTTLKLSTGL